MMPEKHVESYHPNGKLHKVVYLLEGKLHREDGPAVIIYSSKGFIKYREWYFNGTRHRTDDAAFICYKKDGSIDYKVFILYGKEYEEEEEFRRDAILEELKKEVEK